MRRFLTRHIALSVTAVWIALVVALDRWLGLHALAMVLALIWLITVADAWDEETRR